ncbi:DEAD/DEAH box helicase family protein [Aeromicrobium sp. YIM 150415]|uniref:DEAD/DEAH box helicase family protein n=1 Tax=Aeromicrobium sp. YIM 150415 TaxID=2803912 RepID=UPI0019650414|nr:DEAD/DEAH box helicase family protein [Aeromicrobium sp. YIM 150415]MBM9463097.1 DEAD/DEAH box helicase family protein [Aeromicrobium sp. YIM 150415]
MPYALRRFQREALATLTERRREGRRRLWVSLPPGAGKTVLGMEFLRELEQPAVVFCPNTAIQGQWTRTWERYDSRPVSTARDLDGPFTALTYQSLASFDPDERTGEEAPLVDRLHENGKALVSALHAAGPVTVVLDECHHLLETWGALLTEVLAEMPEAHVLGLTATPPGTLSKRQAAQVEELFGDIVYSASIPAAVREGDLAPFAELAWLTTPDADEDRWLDDSSRRFAELTTELLDPDYGTTPLLMWCDRRFGELPVGWNTFAREEPELARSALRLVHAGLLALPEGARLTEEHRVPLSTDDWSALLDDWVGGCLRHSEDPVDEAVIDDLRAALPGIGLQASRRGVSRPAQSRVDRVLSRSVSKMRAAAEIVGIEHIALGERLRAVVVCDFERASATSAAALQGAPAEHGSAFEVMAGLADAPVDAVLMTGRTVAARPPVVDRLLTFIAARQPEIAGRLETREIEGAPDLVELAGPWTSRRWVPLVTDFFGEGHCQVLVGTRALLGEGWDAQQVTTLIDLSTASTSSAVIQTRGRALRIDPDWSRKVALTWSVVCVAHDHPGGDSDWRRFVRKHDGYFGVDDDGQIVSGVPHVDARFSPYVPPDLTDLAAINDAMAVRAQDREVIGRRWRVGEPYEDRSRTVLRVVADGGASVPMVDAPRADPAPPWARMGEHGVEGEKVRRHPWRAAREAARDDGLVAHAYLVADALALGGLYAPGAAGVEVLVDATGAYRFSLRDEPEDGIFAQALEELLAPITVPRYLVARQLAPPAGAAAGWAVFFGRARPVGHTWYAVPGEFARRRDRREAFAQSWARWFGPSTLHAADSPEGEAALAASAGLAPAAVHTLVRSAWS